VNPAEPEIWFVTGSQHLYGAEVIRRVDSDSGEIAGALESCGAFPARVVFKPALVSSEAVRALMLEANASPACAGLVVWMHTFSPAKMWIGGLSLLRKPFAHFHTQFNRDLPWAEIDMDFMNLNQSAHGDREAGHLHTRMGLGRKVVIGHWSDPAAQTSLGAWARAALAWHDWQGARFVRFGDNMRHVAVTEGDKVASEMRFGFSVNGHGVGDLVAMVPEAVDPEVDFLCSEYDARYEMAADLRAGGSRRNSLRDAAAIEIGMRRFLEDGGYRGFTTTFEDLHGLRQLPGLAVQRLMEDGFGFGAEGDWKTAALLRAFKVMAGDLGGTSFMEDYTYHLDPQRPLVLGAHMLEVCPSLAAGKPSCEIHPLGIGGGDDPVRLVFDAPPGPATNTTLVDLGDRFRLLVSEVDAVVPPEPLPRLPVARAVWTCRPDFKTACAAWILAGGAHHTVFSHGATSEHIEDFAVIAGVEFLVIDEATTLRQFRNGLRWNDAAFRMSTPRA
jgi:L-arabinose isomerase